MKAFKNRTILWEKMQNVLNKTEQMDLLWGMKFVNPKRTQKSAKKLKKAVDFRFEVC